MGQQSKIEIILSAVDKGLLAGINRAVGAIRQVATASALTDSAMSALRGSSGALQSSLLRLGAVIGGAGIFNEAKNQSIAFNSTIEQSRIGIAALVRASTDLATGPDAYAQSMDIAAGIQGKLQVEGLKTAATYEQLLKALQEGIGPAFKQGFDPDQVVRFTSLMTQTASAISLPMDQLGQELRAIMDGTIDRNARIAKVLGVTNEKVAEMADQGKLYEYLTAKMMAFSQAGDAMARTYSGSLSNLRDAVQMAIGNATRNSFQALTDLFLRLQGAIVTVDAQAGTFTFNDKIVAAFEQVDQALTKVLGRFTTGELSAMLASLVEMFGTIAAAVIEFASGVVTLWQKLGPLAPAVAEVVTKFILWAGAFKLLLALPLTLAGHLLKLRAAVVGLITLQVVPWLRALEASSLAAVSGVSSLASGFVGLALAVGGYFAAYKAGEWITMRSAVKGTAEAQAQLAKSSGQVVQKLAEISRETGVAVASMEELDQAVKDGKLHYEQSAGAWRANSAEQQSGIEGVTTATEKQEKALKKAWKSYEDNLKSATTQMDAAKSAGELNLAQKALEYEQQGMDKKEAEIKLTKEKLSLLDQEIAKYTQLKASIPTGDSEGKSSQDAAANLEQKINGLRIERVGLLRQEVEGNRTAAKERETNHQKELEDLRELNAEKMRFASQEKILAMELERLEAGKLPTALARAEAEMAIDRRVMAERISLKQQELAALKSADKVDQNDVITKEAELAELAIEKVKQEYANLAAVARESLAATEQAWRRGTGSVEEYRAAVATAGQEGVLTADEVSERMVASGDNMGAALSLGFQKARESMQTDAEMMIYVGQNIGEQISGGLVSAWDAFINGTKSAKEAMIDFARSTISWLAQVILKQMLLNALKAASSAMGYAFGGEVQELASGGSVGGWSPSSTADNIPAWLTAREFVQPVRAVDYYGLDFMERIRRLQLPKSLAHALAGGTLPRIPSGSRLAQGGMAAAAPATTFKGGDTRLRVINVLDKNMVGDYLRTSDGETAIINMIRRNGTTIRTLIG